MSAASGWLIDRAVLLRLAYYSRIFNITVKRKFQGHVPAEFSGFTDTHKPKSKKQRIMLNFLSISVYRMLVPAAGYPSHSSDRSNYTCMKPPPRLSRVSFQANLDPQPLPLLFDPAINLHPKGPQDRIQCGTRHTSDGPGCGRELIDEFIGGHVAKRRELRVGIYEGAVDQTRHIVDFPVRLH
jgi:hypothetical protein